MHQLLFRAMSTNSVHQVVIHHLLLLLSVVVQNGGFRLPDEFPLVVLARVQGRAHFAEETLHPPEFIFVRSFANRRVQDVPQVSSRNHSPIAPIDILFFKVFLGELFAEYYLLLWYFRAKLDVWLFVWRSLWRRVDS